MITTPAGGAVCARRGTSEMPEAAGDEPHHRLPVAGAVRDLGREARAAAAGEEDLVAGPADGRRDPALRRELGEVDAGAAGERVIGRPGRRPARRPSSSSRWKRVSSRRGAAEHSMPRIRSTSRATSMRHGLGRLGLLDAQRDRGRGGVQRPRGGREQAGQRGREAADPHLAARARRPAPRGRPRASRAARTARRRGRAARARRASGARCARTARAARGRSRAPARRAAGRPRRASGAARRRPRRACRDRRRRAARATCGGRP